MSDPAPPKAPYQSRLALRLAVYIFLFSACITIVAAAYRSYSEFTRDIRTIHAGLDQIEKSYIDTLVDHAWIYNLKGIKTSLDGILQLPDTHYAEVRTARGDIITAGEKAKGKTMCRDFGLDREHRGTMIHLGTLSVTASLEGVYQRMIDRAMIILLTQGVQIFLVMIFVFILFYFMIGNPLELIALYAASLDAGTLDRPLHLKRRKNDELDQVADALNAMRNRILTGYLELKHSETALRESEIKFRQLAENIPEVFWLGSPDWQQIYYISPAYQTTWGKTTESLYQNPMSWSENIHEEDRRKMEAVFPISWQPPFEAFIFPEYRIMRPDGTIRWIQARAFPVLDETGSIRRVAGIAEDITDRRLAESEKEKLQVQLTQAQKMESVGRLAGGVAHDFNNMLGVILGHAELALEQVEGNHNIYSDLEEIQKAAQRSADLTKQLLTFARKQIIEPKMLNLNRIVKQMITMLQRLIGEDIDLIWKPAQNLWPVKMDPSQIDQILANLCVNARDAIEGVGKVIIETGMVSFDEPYCTGHSGFIPGDFVLLGVSDNGSGMDKKTLNNLFEPFFTTKEMGKGTGLGLATVYGIVKQNKGFINVYSEPGQGTTFKIYLPRFFAVDQISAVAHSEKKIPAGDETILLVEDEPAILKLTRVMLERKGYSVLSAATPAEAMDLAGNHTGKIDLLMTDVVMPGMNGRDLARQLTALYPDIKLLFMSGYTANVIAHQGILDKGVAFIQKPFSKADLSVKIRSVLDEATDGNQQ
ncbi:MAG: response regulator [Desulfobacula sp.]|jgi:PAS domain S-box-containing protein